MRQRYFDVPRHFIPLQRIAYGIIMPLVFFACDDSFNPVREGESRMIVYSILDATSDVQFVRVYRNYYPADNNPANNTNDRAVVDAIVSITDGVQTFTFRDTLVARDDTSRYNDKIFAYVSHGFRPTPGRTYSLSVHSSSLGTVTAKTTVPTSGNVWIEYPDYFERPNRYVVFGVHPYITFILSNTTSAYVVKFFVEYEADTEMGRKLFQVQIPEQMKILNCLYEVYERTYPKVLRKPPPPRPGIEQNGNHHFLLEAYIRSLELIMERNLNPSFRQAVFYVVQFDESWYRYYGTARTFRDRFTVRLDEPDFSNLQNGVGLFASFVVDSLSHPLPSFIVGPGDGC